MKRFANTVVKVLTAYADLLKQDFPNHVKDEATVGNLQFSSYLLVVHILCHIGVYSTYI